MRWYHDPAYAALLTQKIKSSKWQPDAVIGIGNGGTELGKFIAQKLGRPFESLLIRRPISAARDKRFIPRVIVELVKAFQEPTLMSTLKMDVRGKKILLVDNGMGTGKTIRVAREYLLAKGVHPLSVRTATMYSLKGKRHPQPHYTLTRRMTRAWPARRPKRT